MSDPTQSAERSPWQRASATLAMTERSREVLGSLFAEAEGETVDRLLEEVDQSDYSLDDWAEALEVFEAWLVEQGVDSRPLSNMIGYVHCCTLTNAPGISLPSLRVIVSQALTTFGFEVVSESQL